MNATVAQVQIQLRQKDTDVHTEDGQEILKKCIEPAIFSGSKLQGSP